MKKIITGLTYNTETADFICEIDNELSLEDFKYERGTLYRSKGGRYFLCGRGGALSRFAIVLGDGSRTECASNTIIALQEHDARHLVERNGDVNVYIRCFGEPNEA